MKVQYRKRFLKDLKALKNQPVYEQILQLAFRDLPNAKSLQDIGNVKPMKGATNRYRIRLGEYRLGIAVVDNIVISIKIENINPRFHKGFVGLDCIRLI